MTLELGRIPNFDRLVIGCAFGVAALIGLTVGRGDQVGVQLARFAPVDQARRGSTIVLQFAEEMRRDTVALRLRLEPAVAGDVTWSGRTMVFRPGDGLHSGGRYTVVLEPGAESESGRKVLAERRFGFTVLGPRVAYLAPIDGPVRNVWMVDPLDPSQPRQLTYSRTGVQSFDVRPDGVRLAYTEANPSGGSDLKVLDLDTGEGRPLTSCGDNLCAALAWSPDGGKLAFERRGATPSAIPGAPRDTTRVWLLDASGSAPRAAPLLADPQVPAHFEPRWSPGGDRIAVSQPVAAASAGGGILVHTVATGETAFHRASGAGGFSPDGARFVFPALVAREGETRMELRSVDLDGEGADVPAIPGMSVDPGRLEWRPREGTLTLTRRLADGQRSLGRQIYLGPRDGVQPLLVDAAYDHATFAWDPTGRFLAVERALLRTGGPGADADTRSQVWLLDTADGTPRRIAAGAFHPRWVP